MTHRIDREKSILGTVLEEPKSDLLGGRGLRMDVKNVSNKV
jgi:hypothetical protein